MTPALLADADRSGVFTLAPEHLPAFSAAARQAGVKEFRVDLADCRSVAAVLEKLGHDLDFPDWYGANFDALNDCLGDPDWQPLPALAIHLGGLATLRAVDADSFATLIEVFLSAAEYRREEGCAFWLLLDTPARGVPLLPRA